MGGNGTNGAPSHTSRSEKVEIVRIGFRVLEIILYWRTLRVGCSKIIWIFYL